MKKVYISISVICILLIAFMFNLDIKKSQPQQADVRAIASIDTTEDIDYVHLAPAIVKKYINPKTGALYTVLDSKNYERVATGDEDYANGEISFLKKVINNRAIRAASADEDKELGCCDEFEKLADRNTKPYLYSRHVLLLCLDLAEKKGLPSAEINNVLDRFSQGEIALAPANAAGLLCRKISNVVQGEIISGKEFYAMKGASDTSMAKFSTSPTKRASK